MFIEEALKLNSAISWKSWLTVSNATESSCKMK